MNIEIWLEDLDAEHETIKLRGETASNFRIPAVGETVGAWQDELVQGTETYVLLTVQDVRHYVFKKGMDVSGSLEPTPIWSQEIHVMCANRFSSERPGRRR